MSEQAQDLPVYSRDLWDYLGYMPNLPPRSSRDELVQRAAVDPDQGRRVRIWDYFFRVDPAKVGLPLLDELSRLESELSRGRRSTAEEEEACHQEIERLTAERLSVHNAWLEETERMEREERAAVEVVRKHQRDRWAVFAALSIIGWLMTLGAGAQDGCGSAFAIPLGFGALVVTGITLALHASLKTLDRSVEQRIASRKQELHQRAYARQKQIDQEIEELKQRSLNLGQQWRIRDGEIEHRMVFLQGRRKELLAQIPPSPTDEEVLKWLEEDIAKLKDAALRGSGLKNRLTEIRNAENPLAIRAPSKLQRDDVLLPPGYLDPGDPYFQYLQVERPVHLANGQFVDFYGVYSFAFIIFGEDMLSVFRTLYDFILGEQMGEIGKDVHYLDVVSIESRRGYREIPRKDGKPLFLTNVPSLRLSLPSGEIMEISYPDETYFAKMAAQGSDSGSWHKNPNEAAANAILNVREKLDIAKKSLQMDSGSGLGGPEWPGEA